jgi:nitroreductase
MNAVLETIRRRRTVRAYREEQLPRETLDQILEAGIYAPTGHNDQPWHFTVIRNRDVIGELNRRAKEELKLSPIEWMQRSGNNPAYDISYGAPTLVIVSGRTNAITPLVDCSAAIQNMLLAAESFGVGSAWLGLFSAYLRKPGSGKEYGIPDGFEPYYSVALGFKKDDRELPAPARKSDVTNFIE